MLELKRKVYSAVKYIGKRKDYTPPLLYYSGRHHTHRKHKQYSALHWDWSGLSSTAYLRTLDLRMDTNPNNMINAFIPK